MPKIAFEPCLPTRGTQVPAGPDWIHEIKHDGYRLIVVRDGARVRLFTRNGNDWTKRYPLIVEAALRNRQASFVIDGEAVLLGVDGVSDFNAHSGKSACSRRSQSRRRSKQQSNLSRLTTGDESGGANQHRRFCNGLWAATPRTARLGI
jgi:ATP-dependent DNA ligase